MFLLSYHYYKPRVRCSTVQGTTLLGMRPHMSKCCQQTMAPGPMNLTTKQEDTHCMHMCPTAPHRPSPCI